MSFVNSWSLWRRKLEKEESKGGGAGEVTRGQEEYGTAGGEEKGRQIR